MADPAQSDANRDSDEKGTPLQPPPTEKWNWKELVLLAVIIGCGLWWIWWLANVVTFGIQWGVTVVQEAVSSPAGLFVLGIVVGLCLLGVIAFIRQ